MILTLKDDETIGETRDLVEEGNEYSRVQSTKLNNRMSGFEKHQKEEEEKRRKKEEEAEREEITSWLSLFSFIAKQDELLKNPSPMSANFSGQISASKPGRKAAPGAFGVSASSGSAKPSSPRSWRIILFSKVPKAPSSPKSSLSTSTTNPPRPR